MRPSPSLRWTVHGQKFVHSSISKLISWSSVQICPWYGRYEPKFWSVFHMDRRMDGRWQTAVFVRVGPVVHFYYLENTVRDLSCPWTIFCVRPWQLVWFWMSRVSLTILWCFELIHSYYAKKGNPMWSNNAFINQMLTKAWIWTHEGCALPRVHSNWLQSTWYTSDLKSVDFSVNSK